jgi:hypothetical protein
MAYYSYKSLRDKLQAEGMLDTYGYPVNKEEYGDDLECDYDGNIHEMAVDLINSKDKQLEKLRSSLAWAMKFVEQVRIENPAPKGGGEDIIYEEIIEMLHTN